MKLVGKDRLLAFLERHADARGPLGSWVAEVEEVAWNSPTDIKAKYPSASFLPDNKVIFNIKGNRYRLKVIVAFATQSVVILNVGTHAEYNRW